MKIIIMFIVKCANKYYFYTKDSSRATGVIT